nr:uncharacterized protein LOC124815937 [Hydra vulgaris]
MLGLFCVFQVMWNTFFAQKQHFFPLSQYMNISNIDNIDQFLCQKQSLSFKLCNCNENCFESRTCCIDKLWNNTNPIPLNAYLAMFVNKTKSFKDMVCEKVLEPAVKFTNKIEEVLMVHSCNNSAKTIHINKCIKNNTASNLGNVPVIGSDNTIYRNAACAFCNFVVPYPVKFLFECRNEIKSAQENVTIFQTYETDGVQEILKNYKNCNVSLYRKNAHVINCSSHSYLNDRTCPKSNKYYDLCHAYYGLYRNYRNYDCYKCNNEIKIKKTPIKNINNSQNDYNFTNSTNSFIVPKAMKFSDTLKINEIQSCENKFIYNPSTSKCEPIICNYGFSAAGSGCVKNKNYLQRYDTENANFQNCLLNPKAGFFWLFNGFIDTKTIKYNFREISGAQIQYQNLTNKTLLKWLTTLNLTFLNGLTKKNFSFLNSDSLFITSIYDQVMTELYKFDVSRSFTKNKICAEPQVFVLDVNANFSSLCDYVTVNKTIRNRDFVMWIEVNYLGTVKMMSTCNLFHLQSDCALRILIDNYVIVNQTLIYSYLNTEYKFSFDQFIPFAKGVGVCESTFFALKKQSTLKAFVNLMFPFLTFVSIACYLFVFATYTYFKELRIISNFNSITLCVYLLLSDCTLLLSEYFSKKNMFCKIASVILHWSFLAGYSLVLCMAVELATTFSSVASKSLNQWKVFKINIFVSLLIPTIIVLINLSLEYTGTTYIGYGNDGNCWIDGFYAKLFSYILPLSVFTLSSILCLCITIYKIEKLEKSAKKTLGDGKMSRVNLPLVAMKLTLILGVTDALGFIQITKPYLTKWETEFNYVFFVLYNCSRSSKGIMLFIVYICRKKVIQLFKISFARLTNRIQQKTIYELNSYVKQTSSFK